MPYGLGKPRRTSARRLSDKACATSHRLRWGVLHSSEVDRIVQHGKKGEGRREGRKEGRKEGKKKGKKEEREERKKKGRKERRKGGKKERRKKGNKKRTGVCKLKECGNV